MRKAKKKYEELQSKIFLLSEALEKSESALEKSNALYQEALNFICSITDEREQQAIEFLVKPLEQIVNGTAVDSMGNSGANV